MYIIVTYDDRDDKKPYGINPCEQFEIPIGKYFLYRKYPTTERAQQVAKRYAQLLGWNTDNLQEQRT